MEGGECGSHGDLGAACPHSAPLSTQPSTAAAEALSPPKGRGGNCVAATQHLRTSLRCAVRTGPPGWERWVL